MRRTFGSSLVKYTSGLILLSLVVFALGSYRLIVRPAITELAQAQMGLVSQQVEARVQRLLESVEITLRSSRGWGLNGDLDIRQMARFNEFFFPIISHHDEISSVNLAHESGQEILLLRTPDGKWVNRLSNPQVWGKKTYWITWDANRKFEKSEMRELDYDARKRPWFQGAMAMAKDDGVYWTEPYIFFTTKEPGVTAAMRWRAKDGSRYVIGHDVRLLDLSRFTASIQLGSQGIVALMKGDGTLLALPRKANLNSDEALKSAVLKTADEVGLTDVAAGYKNWNTTGHSSKVVQGFSHEGTRWFSLFRPAALGQQQIWLAVFAPENEFIPGHASDAFLLLLIAAAALGTGSLVALSMARRFAAPLEALTQESERIGHLDLDAPVASSALNAPWREIAHLARAQEVMRQRLLESKGALEQINEQLEMKVEERTLALAHQVALIEALLDIIPNPIFYKGADTRFTGCNQAYEAVFGIGRDKFIGKRVLDLDYLPEAARLAFQAEDEAVIENCSRISRDETMTFADGKQHHTLYSVTGFQNADGTPGGLIGVIVDVSSLKEAERIATEARADAEAAASAKADFLANMSHEIRTPMNAIIGMAHLALQTELTERQRNYLNKVSSAADGLLGLINDILDFSKIEAGMLNCERIEFRLESVISRVSDLTNIRARDKNLELLFDLDADVPNRLIGDPLRLSQVLTNLVSNAVKFTEQGEVTVKVSRLADEGDSPVLRFDVQDTGIGIAPEEIDHIFSAFSQADSSTTRRYGGTGLGLSISKRIVELMGGEIGVTSQPGIGSCFYFSARFEVSSEALAFNLSPLEVHGMRILVVDDNSAAREVFQHMLQTLTFTTEAVSSGKEALVELTRAQQEGQPYRVVLIDWKMPEMDGIETLQRIHTDLGNTAPICLLATAHDRDSLIAALGTTSVDGILDKPATASTLLDTIMMACSMQPQNVLPQVPPKLPEQALRETLYGQRVLLVEDHETNRELALELLQNVGMIVDVAVNGAEALTLIDQQHYAVVLMDCQMPVMDGYEATRRLRADERYESLAIVAMTANAMAGEREKCLDVGMSDYLSKPINVDTLYATLARWVAPASASFEQKISVGGNLGKPSEADDLVLDRATALQRMGGDTALYQRQLEKFSEREADCEQRFRDSLAGNDAQETRRIIHNMKGLAGNIGASRLASACRELEANLDVSGEQRREAVVAWEGALKQVLAAIAALHPKLDMPKDEAVEVINQPNIEVQMRSLAGFFRRSDIKASRAAAELANQLKGSAHEEEASRVAKYAAEYDYDNAMKSLSSLVARMDIAID